MSADPSCTHPSTSGKPDAPEPGDLAARAQRRPSRREFLTAGAAGLAGASFAPAQLAGAPAQLAGARASASSATAASAASCSGEASCSASIRESATSRRPTF
jgi:hypothetical protein